VDTEADNIIRFQGFSTSFESVTSGAAVFAAVIGLILFLSHAIGVLTFPFEMTNGEGLVRDAANIRHGLPVYTDPESSPYTVSN
jgi:hypothetical protein